MRNRLVNARELKRMYEADGAEKTVAHLSEALDEGHLRPQDFSIRELAESLVEDGHEWVATLNPRNQGSHIVEAANQAVDTSAFLNISGQIVYSKIMEKYESEQFFASNAVDTIPTKLNGEKVPGIAPIGDGAEVVGEGKDYPTLGVSEDWVETPATTKRGFIVPITKEAIFFDRTNVLLREAGDVGEWLGVNKEKRILDEMIGVTNSYKWKGTLYSTYQASSPWVNLKTGNELAEWTNVDASEQLFADMLDPNTEEPIIIDPRHLLVTPANKYTAGRILKATGLEYTVWSSSSKSVGPNPLAGEGYVASGSRLFYRRLIESGLSAADAKKVWLHGDFAKAFAYMENWPITVVQSPANSEDDFKRDIVTQFKVSERGVVATQDPRFVVKNTG